MKDPNQHLERTSFQEAGAFDPRIDIKSDVAMVYGVDAGLPGRIETWRKEGYRIHVMTGVAWGNYQDFISGEWNGTNHEDAAQTDRDGKPIMHHPTVPYMCPTEDYGKYLCVGIKRAIDAGAEAVHLEEPEFWVRGGYSEAFKREWQSHYNEPWQPPHSSPDARYNASKLMYFLYRRALTEVFEFIRTYSKQIGRDVKCYVPTHSMINYAAWGIISPEASLVLIDGCDGYIGQVWTGTARSPNTYRGITKERTFEGAFCEYGVLHNLVRSTGKRMWYLNDPVEDRPDYCWEDYRVNWESTLVASLLWPDVWRFEVAPWPSRVFKGTYPKRNLKPGEAADHVEREPIPATYATELLTVFNELNNMDRKEVSWDCGTRGIGILVSDTMMFQRAEPHPSEQRLGSFFGLAMPLIKKGAPVEPVQLENVILKDYLKAYKVLFLTYEGMKPPTPELHDALVGWVNSGGVLVFVDDDKDPYNAVREWWNTSPLSFATPRLHLFEKLGISSPGTHKVGRGSVIYAQVSPASLSLDPAGAGRVITPAKEACAIAGVRWTETSYMLLRRGPYVIGAGFDETEGLPTQSFEGEFVNLFSPTHELFDHLTLSPGARVFALDLARVDRSSPVVLASASKILGATTEPGEFRFHSEGPEGTQCVTRIALPSKPTGVQVGGTSVSYEWHEASNTALLLYPNSPDGVWVKLTVDM